MKIKPINQKLLKEILKITAKYNTRIGNYLSYKIVTQGDPLTGEKEFDIRAEFGFADNSSKKGYVKIPYDIYEDYVFDHDNVSDEQWSIIAHQNVVELKQVAH